MIKPACPDISSLTLTFLLDQRKVQGHVVKGLLDGLERNLKIFGELLRGAGIRTVDRLVNYGSREYDAP